jgi:hypothetical protein
MKPLAALIGMAICLSTDLRAQEIARTPRAPGPVAESTDRIARETWPTDAWTFTIDEEGRPRFRSGVTVTLPPPLWHLTPDDASPVPARGALTHREMLGAMTPEPFRDNVMYPGVSVDPGSIYHGIVNAWRAWQARRIHERVTRELEEFLRAAEERESN